MRFPRSLTRRTSAHPAMTVGRLIPFTQVACCSAIAPVALTASKTLSVVLVVFAGTIWPAFHPNLPPFPAVIGFALCAAVPPMQG